MTGATPCQKSFVFKDLNTYFSKSLCCKGPIWTETDSTHIDFTNYIPEDQDLYIDGTLVCDPSDLPPTRPWKSFNIEPMFHCRPFRKKSKCAHSRYIQEIHAGLWTQYLYLPNEADCQHTTKMDISRFFTWNF